MMSSALSNYAVILSTGGSNFAGFMKSVESLVEEDFITFLKSQLDKVCRPASAGVPVE